MDVELHGHLLSCDAEPALPINVPPVWLIEKLGTVMTEEQKSVPVWERARPRIPEADWNPFARLDTPHRVDMATNSGSSSLLVIALFHAFIAMGAFNGIEAVGALGGGREIVGWVNVSLSLLAVLVFFRVRRTRSLILAWTAILWATLFLLGPVSIWLFSGTMPFSFSVISVVTSIMLLRAARAHVRLTRAETGI
ncbi:hypothetical protein D3C72_1336270 [compost metagenome]